MYKFQVCTNFKQIVLAILLAASHILFAGESINRKPANFIPNDDVILVPLEYETHFMVRHIDPTKPNLALIKNQIETWVTQEQYVREWGIESTGLYRPPTQEEKLNFFQRNFLRYVSKETREPLKQTVNEWWNQDDAETEVQRVKQVTEDTNSKKDKVIATKIINKKSEAKAEEFKIKFKPRPLKGFFSLALRSSYFNADGVLGVNGRFDIRLWRTFSSIGVDTMAYYDLQAQRTITSITKRLTPTVDISLTSTFTPIETIKEDHRLRIGYNKAF